MKTEKIKFEAVSAKVESFGGAVQVTTEVEPSAILGLFTWADIREFYEEQIEDEILEARNEGYKRGLEDDRDIRSFEAEQRMRLRHED